MAVWAGACSLAIAFAGAWVAGFMSRSPDWPLHFWIRAGEVDGVLFESPGGRVIEGWVRRPSTTLLRITPEENGAWTRLLKWCGFQSSQRTDVEAAYMARDGELVQSGEFLECVAVGASGWPDGAVPDAHYAGRWCRDDDNGGFGWFVLGRDGSAEFSLPLQPFKFRWGRTGDVLIIQSRLASATSPFGCLQTFVLENDGGSARARDGTTWRLTDGGGRQ